MKHDQASQYEMTFSTFGRLNHELWYCNNARRDEELASWWKSIENIYIELAPFLKLQDSKAQAEQYQKNYILYIQLMNYKASFRQGRSSRVPFQPPNVYPSWFAWELELRRLLDKEGILIAKSEGAGGQFI